MRPRAVMLEAMDVTPAVSGHALGSAAPPARARGRAVRTFAAAFDEQTRRAAARDLLASMPPFLAWQIQRTPPDGPPPDSAVHELFKAIKSGEFTPTADHMAGANIISATARAAEVFDSPEQMWGSMRAILGAGDAVADAVRAAAAERAGAPSPPPTTSPEAAATALGGPLPLAQLAWWESALLLLLKDSPLVGTKAGTT